MVCGRFVGGKVLEENSGARWWDLGSPGRLCLCASRFSEGFEQRTNFPPSSIKYSCSFNSTASSLWKAINTVCSTFLCIWAWRTGQGGWAATLIHLSVVSHVRGRKSRRLCARRRQLDFRTSFWFPYFQSRISSRTHSIRRFPCGATHKDFMIPSGWKLYKGVCGADLGVDLDQGFSSIPRFRNLGVQPFLVVQWYDQSCSSSPSVSPSPRLSSCFYALFIHSLLERITFCLFWGRWQHC